MSGVGARPSPETDRELVTHHEPRPGRLALRRTRDRDDVVAQTDFEGWRSIGSWPELFAGRFGLPTILLLRAWHRPDWPRGARLFGKGTFVCVSDATADRHAALQLRSSRED